MDTKIGRTLQALLGITDPFEPQAFPVRLWDVFGQAGHPVRATVEGMGSLLLSRLLDLNETQSGILAIVSKVAQEKDWPLIDLKGPAKPFKGSL